MAADESMPAVLATAFMGISLDGFIAREDGGIDWLDGDPTIDGEDYGFHAFFNTVDALVMGRNTWELARSFPQWPYGDKRVVVLSSREVEIPSELSDRVEHMAGTPAEIVERLGASGARHLYIDGGKTVQAFLSAGLVQKMVITRLPVLIGTGIPLFGPVPHDIRLRHVSTKAYENGLVQSEYELKRPAPST